MLSTVRWRLAIVALVLVSAGCAPSSEDSVFPAPTTTTSARPGDDLRFLASEITTRHPEPFANRPREAFEELITSDPDNPDELLVASMRIANLGAGDGHGGVYPWAQRSLTAWPLHLYLFPDGVRVVAGEGVPVGARLTAVGDTDIDEVLAAVRPLVPHDNAETIEARLPAYLAFPAVLRGVGFDASELTWELPDGKTLTEEPPDEISSEAFRDLLGLFQAQVPPSLPYDHDVIFRSEQRGRVLFVEWNQVQSTNGSVQMRDFAASLVGAVESGAADAVVVDVRHNPGGDVGDAAPLADAVLALEARRPGTVTFLIGRSTFSAAALTLADLEADFDVRTVGETTGGNAGIFSEPVHVTLPASGIVAYVSTDRFLVGNGVFAGIDPDVAIETTWADYEAGRDAVYEAAVS